MEDNWILFVITSKLGEKEESLYDQHETTSHHHIICASDGSENDRDVFATINLF